MKKLLISLLLVFAICLVSQAQFKFYYYPSTNIYYDFTQRRYLYVDNGNWTPVKVLPSKFKGVTGPRYIVYNNAPDIWIANDVHIKKYKTPKHITPQGKAVGYKHTNPKKSSGKGNGKMKNKH